ncbi:MAG: hypothetical protein HC880_21735 [Bacteroidia bacterium]|nr:hypothetical protein [Bacteroidia bacterium]
MKIKSSVESSVLPLQNLGSVVIIKDRSAIEEQWPEKHYGNQNHMPYIFVRLMFFDNYF